MNAPSNLPVEANAFIGRASDVGELLDLLAAARAVTLCGSGGIGKTRLALRVAREAAATFADGVWLVELADVDSGGRLAEHVATALGVTAYGAVDATQAVVSALACGRQLVVVDNCEHLIDECARLCARLLASCPELRLLATSREPLRVQGETVWRVPPLSVTATADAHSDAVRLFVDRAGAARPGARWNGADGEAVAALCAALEGIPLAIELAAAMTRVLSVEQITARLCDRFHLLTNGARTAPARQRTLLATVEWSYRMLTGPQQLLLRRLTVFRGGWTLGMAERVCTSPGLRVEQVLQTLTELVDKSLVLADELIGEEVRYRMLETVRDYARQLLPPGAGDDGLRQRHLLCLCEMAAHGGELIAQRSRSTWPEVCRQMSIIDAMQPNLYAAMGYAIATGQIERGLRVCTDLHWAIISGGRFDEYVRLLDRLLENAAAAPPGLVGEALALRAALCYFGGDAVPVVELATRSLSLSRLGGNRTGEGLALIVLSMFEPRGAEESLRRAFELAREADDGYLEAFALYAQAMRAQLAGRLREAERGYLLLLDNQRDANDWGMAMAIIGLAELAHGRGDLAAAMDHYEHAQRLLDTLDYRGERIRCLNGLGRIAIELGDVETARARLAESLSLSSGLGRRATAVELVGAFAELACLEGDHCRAVRLAGASAALRQRMGVAEGAGVGTRAEVITAAARRELGEPMVARLWSEGVTLPWARTVEYALSDPPSGRPVPPLAEPVRAAPAGVLTEREREIAALIARGLSNRALADELVISPATVARHVSNILAKLGFTSRIQVAAWVIEHVGGPRG